jgi:nucleoid DNA-binding protein
MKIPSQKTVTFKLAKDLKDALNSTESESLLMD